MKTTHAFFKSLLLGSILGIMLTACLEDGVENRSAADDEAIQNYLNTLNIIAERTPSGLYYTILSEGSGEPATETMISDVAYDLTLLESNREVEAEDSYVFRPSVGSFLPGLTEGVQLMREGATYRFYVPSTLAFGISSGDLNGVFVPSNSIFIMDVTLNEVRTDAEQRAHEQQLLNDFLAGNDEHTDGAVDTTATGVIKAVINEGTGSRTPFYGAGIVVSYNGRFTDGEVFDQNAGLSFSLDTLSLIKGWYDGISRMKMNEEALLLIPSHRAYGESGTIDIPPFTPLVFRVRLENF